MKCQVCGAESGKYPLCRACNMKKEQGEVIKCSYCGRWHYADQSCKSTPNNDAEKSGYLYDKKPVLMTKIEQNYYYAVKYSLPEGYLVFPQINLAAFIKRTDNVPYHNELFRNVDFLITDKYYSPKIVVEINDSTHLNSDRKERDEKVTNILEEAGIPLLKLWTSYGINQDYIKEKIEETLNAPIVRKHHVIENKAAQQSNQAAHSFSNLPSGNNSQYNNQQDTRKNGCYIATCVYGSYDCPHVWVLRRYRDNKLARTFFGRLFIKVYYKISPELVRRFGKSSWFCKFWKSFLDKKVRKLYEKGYLDTPYYDI